MDWKDNLKESIEPKKIKMNSVRPVDVSSRIYRKAADYVYDHGCYVCVIPSYSKNTLCFMDEKIYINTKLNCQADYYIYSDLVVNKNTGEVIKNRFGGSGNILNM